jgi:hypothetical protein
MFLETSAAQEYTSSMFAVANHFANRVRRSNRYCPHVEYRVSITFGERAKVIERLGAIGSEGRADVLGIKLVCVASELLGRIRVGLFIASPAAAPTMGGGSRNYQCEYRN